MELEEVLREIQSLKKKVQYLTKEIESIKAVFVEDPSSVEKMLKMRGIKDLPKESHRPTLLSSRPLPFS